MDLLPTPAATGDDLMTALAMLTIRQKHEDRVASNAQRISSEKAQADAQVRKLEKMRDLAKDTWIEGLIEGLLEGAAAAASALSAVEEFSSATQPQGAETLKFEQARNAKLFDASSKALGAASRFGGAMAKSAQEDDRKDMAIADGDVDRAKSAVDSASSAARQADDDIRETLNAIRQYLAAKTQLANAAIIKG